MPHTYILLKYYEIAFSFRDMVHILSNACGFPLTFSIVFRKLIALTQDDKTRKVCSWQLPPNG